MSEEKLAAKVNKTEYLEITLREIVGGRVTLSYETLANNKPNKNGEYIALWRTDKDFLLPGENAKWSELMKSNEVSGTSKFKMPIDDHPHIIGYCPTGDPKKDLAASKNVAAIIKIDGKKLYDDQKPTTITLNITGIDTDVLELHYSLLKGMSNTGHRIKIWEKPEAGSFDFDEDTFYEANVDNYEKGCVDLGDAGFTRETSYALRYYFDADCKHLVGSIEFDT